MNFFEQPNINQSGSSLPLSQPQKSNILSTKKWNDKFYQLAI